MEIVPDLGQDSLAVVHGSLTSGGGVVRRPRAPNIRQSTVPLVQSVLHGSEVVADVSGVGRTDVGSRQPSVSRKTTVVENSCGVEIGEFLVLNVFGSVAGDVEGGEACSVLGKFVGPEVVVGCALVDPVFVHVGEQVILAQRLEERCDVAGTLPCWDSGTVGEAVGCVW